MVFISIFQKDGSINDSKEYQCLSCTEANMHTLTTNIYPSLISEKVGLSFPSLKAHASDLPSKKTYQHCLGANLNATSWDLSTLCFSFLIRFYGFGFVFVFSKGSVHFQKEI